jgi:hypothetical protein
MGKPLRLALVVVTSLLLVGCSPVKCLFPLFTDTDQLFDPNLIGEWRVAPEQNQGDKVSTTRQNERWIFQKTLDHPSYDCSQIELGKHGAVLSTAQLVKLGDTLFVDFSPGPAFPEGPQDTSYPRVDAHAIGRIWAGKDEIKIRFLDAKWAWKQIHAGNFPLTYVDAPTDLVVTATTDQLRKFASDHADDKEAFSVEFRLIRMK